MTHRKYVTCMRYLKTDNQFVVLGGDKVFFCLNIFPKLQVTFTKEHTTSNTFFGQFFMLFHMVGYILFGVLGQETTFSLVEVLQEPIRNFHFKVFRANTRSKMDHIMWKSMKNWAQKWCRSLCAFLFDATCAFGKICLQMNHSSREKIALSATPFYQALSRAFEFHTSLVWGGAKKPRIVPRKYKDTGLV